MKPKEEVVKKAWIKAIGLLEFEKYDKYIDENGFIDKQISPLSRKGIVVDEVKKSISKNYKGLFERPISLKGIETNNGWISIQSENWLKEHKINGSNTKFYVDNPDEDYLTIEILVSDGKNQEQLTLSDYLFIKDELLQKGIKATYYAPIEKKQPPLHK
jgi:hypothetical protein